MTSIFKRSKHYTGNDMDIALHNKTVSFTKKNEDQANENNKKFTAIDLFCGAGGLAYGFKNAGINIIAGIDNNDEALVTFKKNIPEAKAISYDLSNIDDSLIAQLGKVDIMLGGPPCQGFSIAGKRQSTDPRNLLVQSYLKLVEVLSPRVVVIENVPNILSMENGEFANNIISGLKSLGYNVDVHKLNSADFGVPQNRKRVIFIAMKDKHFDLIALEKKKVGEAITTEAAISDLPLLNDNLGAEEIEYSTPAKTKYQINMRKDSQIISNHHSVDHKPQTKMIIAMVPDGGNYKALPKEYQLTRKVNIAWTRMNSKKPCFTIDAGHNHHFHYKADRVPTVRECARIQSFPDNFVFMGKRTSQYRQVGNAVPPILAQKIAEAIIETIGS